MIFKDLENNEYNLPIDIAKEPYKIYTVQRTSLNTYRFIIETDNFGLLVCEPTKYQCSQIISALREYLEKRPKIRDRIMPFECEIKSKSGHWVYSYDKEQKILKSRTSEKEYELYMLGEIE